MLLGDNIYVYKTFCNLVLCKKWWHYTFALSKLVIFIYDNGNGLPITKKRKLHFLMSWAADNLGCTSTRSDIWKGTKNLGLT